MVHVDPSAIGSTHDPPMSVWIIVLSGPKPDLQAAVTAIERNQQEVYRSCSIEAEHNEYTATVTLRWVDTAMTVLVRSIIEKDFPNVKIRVNEKR